MKRLMAILMTGGVLLSLPTQAQQSRYSTWSDPNASSQSAGSAQTANMINELRALVKEAEKARAADPNFLKDLQGLANRYDNVPSLSFSLKDDFLDGDYTKNPAWTVASGRFWVEKGYGLRSFVEAGSTSQTNNHSPSNDRKISNEELVIGILGAVLGGTQKSTTQNQQSGQRQNSSNTAFGAEIFAPSRIYNAFDMKVDLSSWKTGGKVELGPYQDGARQTGYRLVYHSGQSPTLRLERRYKNSTEVLASVYQLSLEDQKIHKVRWMRDRYGKMTVDLDDKRLFSVSDTGFRDDFQGFVLKNAQGDFIMSKIEVSAP